MRYSENWKNWVARIDEKTCKECRDIRFSGVCMKMMMGTYLKKKAVSGMKQI